MRREEWIKFKQGGYCIGNNYRIYPVAPKNKSHLKFYVDDGPRPCGFNQHKELSHSYLLLPFLPKEETAYSNSEATASQTRKERLTQQGKNRL